MSKPSKKQQQLTVETSAVRPSSGAVSATTRNSSIHPPEDRCDEERRVSTLPRQLKEQILNLYLHFEGVTQEKIPNFLAALRLSAPVDFEISRYFVSSRDKQTQLIIQPEELFCLVQDLQLAAGRVETSGATDACAVLAMEHRRRINRTTTEFSEDSLSAKATSHITQQDVETVIQSLIPDASARALATVALFAGTERSNPSTQPPQKSRKSQSSELREQPVRQICAFLQSDDTEGAVARAFLRVGAVDKGYGLLLETQDVARACRSYRISRGVTERLLALLDPDGGGEIDLATFTDVYVTEINALKREKHLNSTSAPPGAPGNAAYVPLGLTGQRDLASPPPLLMFLVRAAPDILLKDLGPEALKWLQAQHRTTKKRGSIGLPGGAAETSKGSLNAVKPKAQPTADDDYNDEAVPIQDLNSLLDDAGIKKARTKTAPMTAKPRYMQERPDNEMTLAIKNRVRAQRSLPKEERWSHRALHIVHSARAPGALLKNMLLPSHDNPSATATEQRSRRLADPKGMELCGIKDAPKGPLPSVSDLYIINGKDGELDLRSVPQNPYIGTLHRLHSAPPEVKYKYECLVDSWRNWSPRKPCGTPEKRPKIPHPPSS
jgi:hypothetical protein